MSGVADRSYKFMILLVCGYIIFAPQQGSQMYLTQPQTYFFSDAAFDSLFPIHIQKLSAIHWTPVNVAITAARFLNANGNAKILDIGAGVGKFCITGSFFTNGHFTGVEQRRNFVTIGNKMIKQFGLNKVELIHGNFTEIDMSLFNGIYFYNSFHENIVLADSLDEQVERSSELYNTYTAHLLARLNQMPVGTRLATDWLSITEIPACYRLYETHYNKLLKLWIKEY